jgi:Gpi18-like mannosyltransferase
MKKIISIIYRKINTIHIDDLVLIIGGIFLALLLRYLVRSYPSGDFEQFNKVWYETIKSRGFAAFDLLLTRGSGYNYSPMYLYLLSGVSILYPKLVTISAVKLVSVTFDMLEALIVYKIVRLKFTQGPIPFLATIAILFAPTIVLNSSVWGQTDSIYTAFLLASLYFIMKKQNWWACLAYGLALSMKFQAVFFAPFLVALFLKKEISWKQILLIPVVYFATCIPAWIGGRPIGGLLTIYFRQGNQNPYFEISFPNLYFQLPDDLFHLFFPATLVIAASMAFIYIGSIYTSHIKITRMALVQLALVSVVIMPYFMPKMHDRYLYSADALSIIFGFYFPEYYLIPVMINLFSFFVYESSLFGMENISGYVLQILYTFIVVYLSKIMITTLFSSHRSMNNSGSDMQQVDQPDGLPKEDLFHLENNDESGHSS